MLATLTATTIRGTEHVPLRGPYIIAGNHRGIMEVALMLKVAPTEVEIIGAGDVPLDRRYRYFAHLYGFIPYRRGSLDRGALRRAASVLQRGGVVGIFPEGGIWTTERTGAHRGVAWLSQVASAPVVPVGFGGVAGAVHATVTLSRPRLEARIGEPLSPPTLEPGSSPRRLLEGYAESVMDVVEALIPEWDRDQHASPHRESWRLVVRAGRRGTPPDRATEVQGRIAEADVIARLMHAPVIIDTLYFNMKRTGVGALRRPGRRVAAAEVARAARIVRGFMLRTNPGFFPYRFGDRFAARLDRALASLAALGDECAVDGGYLVFDPIHERQWTADGPMTTSHTPPRSRHL